MIPVLTIEIENLPIFVIQKGASIKLGRHPNADICVDDRSVSRIHVAIRWKETDEYPIISDCDSIAGLEIDDQYVGWKHLHQTHKIKLGNCKIIAKFHPSQEKILKLDNIKMFAAEKQQVNATKTTKIKYYGDETLFIPKTARQRAVRSIEKRDSAVLPSLDDSDEVILISDYGRSEEKGNLKSNKEIHNFLTKLDFEERTGTLTLDGTYSATMTFASGKIRNAKCGKLRDMMAIQQVFTFLNATYHFTPTCEVGESVLNIRPSQYLRQISRHATNTVSRPSQRFKKLFTDE